MNMRFKKFALVLAIVLMAGTLTSALASPFADVPADHWAYDAVVELAAAGLIEGYPDGTYGGARMMTRYEAAMVFARALQRLESQIAANNLLPELDRIKAELMAEIEAAKAAAAAAAEKEPIETTVVEKVIVDKDVDPEALARIRANEIANEALAGDMAYLEARMLGLIDGIRYDLDQLKDRPVEVPEVEVPSMEEIEELIAKRIEESILEAAAAAKETTIIERVVATTPELSKEDVEFIAEALIRAQVSRLELLINENRAMIAALSEWVDEIDTDVAAVKEDLAGVKEDVAGLQDAVSVLEKVQFSGKLGLNAEKKVGETELKFSQTGSLNLNVKASEATNVKAFVDWTLTPFEWETTLEKYGVEVTSSTPLKSLLVGYVAKGKLSPFNYVLSTGADYGFGGVANVEIIDGLTFDLFAGQKAKGDTEFDAAAALSYKFMDELGVRIKGKATKPHSGMFKDNYAAGIGLFGEVAGIKYTGDFAMDFSAKDKNYIGVGTVETSFGDLKLDAKVAFQEEKYSVTNALVYKEDYRLGVEGGLGTKFGPVSLNARAYYEGLPHTDDSKKGIVAFKADASAEFDLFVPLTLSGEVMGAQTNDADAEMKMRAFAKLAFAQNNDYGLRYGLSAAYEHNGWGVSSPNWKKAGDYGVNDNATFAANVGYGVDLSGAKLDLDYKATFVLPIIKDGQDERDYGLTHNVDLAYAFTENVKLTLGGTVKQTIPSDKDTGTLTNQFGYKAGLTVSF